MKPSHDWWRGASIYQIYLRSFFDSNRDGIGDLPGVDAKLSYISSLGVDAMWLCPFYPSPKKDFGYDVSDFTGVDSCFGSMQDFDRLVRRAHALNLRVLIDQVWSHTSDAHPWFLQSRASRDNGYADWYVWADPSPDGTPPNNWLSVFGGPAWTWEPRRRQYYLHHFLSAQPSLNVHNPEVVEELLTVGRFWLDRGVDGFRLDAIDFLAHDPSLSNNPPNEPWGGITPVKLFALQDHVYDMLHPARMQVLKQIRQLLDDYDAVALGEVSSQPGAFRRVMDYTSSNDLLHMAYTLSPLRHGFDWEAISRMLHNIHEVGDDGWPCWSFSNHDVERAVSRWNPNKDSPQFPRLLTMFLLCLRGSVCIYQGEELGLTEATLTFDQLRDPFGINYWPEFRGRDGSRTPMPWRHDIPHGGFTEGDHPWLPIPGDHYALAVSQQEDNDGSLLNFWRDMLALRRAYPALIKGSLIPMELPKPLVGFIREYDSERLVCLFNLADETVTVDMPEAETIVSPYAYAICLLDRTEPGQYIRLSQGRCGGTVDTPDLGSGDREVVGVQISPPAVKRQLHSG